ncbi:MAG TPA: hypothetical protein PLW65_05220 [Pseudomonadota bacterium]|nr:hypothetical protein [Pseudomonadota bacterium]
MAVGLPVVTETSDKSVTISAFQIKAIEKLSSSDPRFKTMEPCQNGDIKKDNNLAKIEIRDQCISDKGIYNSACSSVFKIELDSLDGMNQLPDMVPKKIQINGSHSSKSFLSLEDKDHYIYWIDTMEVFTEVGSNINSVGFIYGHEPGKNFPIQFNRDILPETHGLVRNIFLKYTRQCYNKDFDLSKNKLPFTDLDHTIYTISSIDYQITNKK